MNYYKSNSKEYRCQCPSSTTYAMTVHYCDRQCWLLNRLILIVDQLARE